MTAPCSPNAKSTARRVKCPPSNRCWPAWTLPVSWSLPTRCTQRDHASFLVGRGADYLLVVKANQPTLGFQGRYRVSVDASSIAVFRWIVDQ